MATVMDMPGTRARAFEPGMAASVGADTRTPGWDLATERRIDDGRTLANQIGWFSIGLGLAEIAAPDRICEWLGMEGSENLVRLFGVREITKAVGILSNRRPAGWMWARVFGDVLDLATLGSGLVGDNPRKRNVALAIAAVAGVTALDVLCAKQLSQPRHQH
ncbi:MAG TPA: hypothetical protein VHG91_09935 [Longimicrobium sp.]|nr:hypothetical protein [Longimicrobium sp.]